MMNILTDLPGRVAGSLATLRFPEFQHEVLKYKKSTRLVAIQPPTIDHLLHCSVEEVILDPAQNPNLEYEALSYTWFIDRCIGSPIKGTMKTIVCNGATLEVHQNLYNGLLQLRELKRGLRIWIDAICINQSDDDEKGAQVNMMGEIFGGAKTVLVWLGTKTLVTALALMKIRWLLETGSIFQENAQTLKDGVEQFRLSTLISFGIDMMALRWILGRGFFERVWTLQEVVLAKDIIFYLGDEPVPLDRLVNNFPYMETENIHNPTMTGDQYSVPLVAMLRRLIFMHKTRMQRIKGKLCTLEVAVAEARRRKTTKPADKVFAILSICDSVSDAGELRANYRKRVDKVYCECAKTLLTGPTSLRLLSLVGQLRHGAMDHPSFPSVSTKDLIQDIEFVAGLPSWVPDLSTQVRPHPLHSLTQTVDYMAATSINPSFKVLDNYKLHLRAALVDVITDIGDGIDLAGTIHKPWKFIEIPTRLGTKYGPTGEPVISAFRKTLVVGEIAIANPIHGTTVEINESHFADWFCAIADTLVLTQPAVQYILQDQEIELTDEELKVDVFERKTSYTVIENLARAKRRIKAIRKFIAMYDGPEYQLREKLYTRYCAHKSATGLKAAGARVGFQTQPEARNPPPYMIMFDKFYLHRHLFITGKGYMGTGPWTIAKGDVVMLVAGAPVPYIFRSKGDGTWELVGEAYCHGMMGGSNLRETVPGLDLDTLNFDMITVV